MTKIVIHTEEIEALQEKEFFELKAKATEKIRALLLETNAMLHSSNAVEGFELIEPYFLRQGKVSRGENFKGLPYLVLDYPGYFKPESVLTFRCMFWWGNYFSFYWVLSGDLFHQHKSRIELEKLKDKDYTIANHDELWEHRFEEPYVTALNEKFLTDKSISELAFLKIGKRLPTKEWEQLPEQAMNVYKEVMTELLIPAFRNQ